MIKRHSCPFCRKTVYDKRKHPEQCIILFQMCFGWRRVHGTHAARNSRPALTSDSTVALSLHAFFKRPSEEDRELIAARRPAGADHPFAPGTWNCRWALGVHTHRAEHGQHMLCQCDIAVAVTDCCARRSGHRSRT